MSDLAGTIQLGIVAYDKAVRRGWPPTDSAIFAARGVLHWFGIPETPESLRQILLTMAEAA